MTSSSGSLRNISDTALLVAWYRTLETRRKDAIFRDEFAERLGGPRAEQVSRELGRERFSAWPNIVRTYLIDEIVQQEVARGADVVLNLAAGLDSRPYRLNLPASLRWIEVDLPDMIAYKEQALAGETPRCQLEHIALDLRDVAARRALFQRVSISAKHVLVISEGLLIYLAPDAVAALATDLANVPNFSAWIFDLAGPGVLKRLKKMWGKKLKAADSEMHFAPVESDAFFRPYGWQTADFRELLQEGIRLHRHPPMLWVMKLYKVLAPRRFERLMKELRSGVVRLVRASA